MAVYRFKISFEDHEDVYREIEIKSTQNFEDFHNTIVQSIGFDNQHESSFFISDDYWRKGEEVVLHLKEADNKAKKQDTGAAKKEMNKCKMASLIDDPHQKFIFVYDPKTAWSFLVELMKIVPDDAKASYPRVVKTVGESPKQYKSTTAVAVDAEEEFDEDEPPVDDAAYENAHSEDETALLQSEEGEIDVAEEDETASAEEDEMDASEFEDHAGEQFEED